MAASRPISELAPGDVITQLQQEVSHDSGPKQKSGKDLEQAVRAKIDSFHMEVFQHTQTETTKRWTYESEVKRPYYHVTELDEPQLLNWKKYLDFEEAEGDYTRTKFLYERCLVTAANYEEFWLRYARWMLAQENKQEEVRNIYQRASCIYVPISSPMVRLYYAHFEEAEGRSDVAAAIHEAILMNIPNHVETIKSLVNVHRRQYGFASAVQVLQKYLNSHECDVYTRGAMVSEWARLIWKVLGDADEARKVYQSNQQSYLDCRTFWNDWLEFEMQQPTSEEQEPARYAQVKAVFDEIRSKSRLPPDSVRELSELYFVFLRERGGKDAMKEYMKFDREINGPIGVTTGVKEEVGMEGVITQGRPMLQNGNQGAETNGPGTRHGGASQTKHRQRLPPNGNPTARVTSEV